MQNFKNCRVCNTIWTDRDNFLADPDVKIIGYQVDFHGDRDSLLLFNHQCGTTLSVPVTMFGSLYNGPRYKNILTDSEHCQGHCLDENDLSPCGAECKLAYGMEIIQVIKNWPKK